ncbi:MAG: hypothetical protein ACOCRX_05990 [Candidatus Woesearchaeota archaeon]
MGVVFSNKDLLLFRFLGEHGHMSVKFLYDNFFYKLYHRKSFYRRILKLKREGFIKESKFYGFAGSEVNEKYLILTNEGWQVIYNRFSYDLLDNFYEEFDYLYSYSERELSLDKTPIRDDNIDYSKLMMNKYMAKIRFVLDDNEFYGFKRDIRKVSNGEMSYFYLVNKEDQVRIRVVMSMFSNKNRVFKSFKEYRNYNFGDDNYLLFVFDDNIFDSRELLDSIKQVNYSLIGFSEFLEGDDFKLIHFRETRDEPIMGNIKLDYLYYGSV